MLSKVGTPYIQCLTEGQKTEWHQKQRMGVVVCRHYFVDNKISGKSQHLQIATSCLEGMAHSRASINMSNKFEKDILFSLPEPKFLMQRKISSQVLMLLKSAFALKTKPLTAKHTEGYNLHLLVWLFTGQWEGLYKSSVNHYYEILCSRNHDIIMSKNIGISIG